MPSKLTIVIVSAAFLIGQPAFADEKAPSIAMSAAMLASADIGIGTAGPAILRNRLRLYGRIGPNADALAYIQPRFPGVVRAVRKRLGDSVAKDEAIATVESNQSLTSYEIRSPLAGTVVEKDAALGAFVGEQSRLFVVANLATVWVDFSVHRQDMAHIRTGLPVTVDLGQGAVPAPATIAYVSPLGAPDTQTMLARAVVDNPAGLLRPGLFVSGAVALDELPVALAIEDQAIQTVDSRPVVFVRNRDGFEARVVELGRRDGDHAEVLSGLEPGERYATRNSFIIKAELGKSSVEE